MKDRWPFCGSVCTRASPSTTTQVSCGRFLVLLFQHGTLRSPEITRLAETVSRLHFRLPCLQSFNCRLLPPKERQERIPHSTQMGAFSVPLAVWKSVLKNSLRPRERPLLTPLFMLMKSVSYENPDLFLLSLLNFANYLPALFSSSIK